MNSILCRDTIHLDSRSIESVPVVRSSSSTGGWYALYPITVSLIFYIPPPPPLSNAAKTRFVYLDLGVVSTSVQTARVLNQLLCT